jgi:hypothetical protein
VDPKRRGRLFAMECLGEGSALVESLTSYVARLAQAHYLTSGILVMQELAPLFRRKSITDGRGQCDLFSKVGASLNGMAGIAAEAVGLLEFLTRRDSLAQLTLLPLKNVISARSSIRLHKAWCPRCLHEWNRNSQPVRDLLAWQISAIRVCPFHSAQLLWKECPHCGRLQLPLTRYSLPGFCSRCQGWLGTDQAATSSNVTKNEEQMANEVRLLLEAAGQPTWSTSIVTLRNNLNYITRRFFSASCSAFANAAGLHHSSMADILRGTAKPGLSTLLQMSIAAGIPAVRILERPLDLDPIRSKNSAGLTFPRKFCRNYDWPRLAGALAQLNQTEGNVVSLNNFCRGQGCDPGYVAKRLSGSARPIIAKFRNFTAGRHKARLDQEEAELRSAVNTFLRGGQWPSLTSL